METLAQQLCRLAKDALELEDRILRRQARRNASVYSQPEKQPGILRFNNEHYYQFVVARHLVGTVPYRVEAEVNKEDLILWEGSSTLPLASIELKRWMSESGTAEIKGIQHDLCNNLPLSKAARKFMMILSANPESTSDDETIGMLAKHLGDERTNWVVSSFRTFSIDHRPFAFWVAVREI